MTYDEAVKLLRGYLKQSMPLQYPLTYLTSNAAGEALDAIEAEHRRLREALEFYAQERGLGARLASDGGMIARAALAGRDREQG